MKTGRRSLLILLWFNTIHDIKVLPEVTGYVRHDVRLPCDFIPGQNDSQFHTNGYAVHFLKSQDIKVPPEVTRYVGHDVTLPCHFIQGQNDSKITQVQWALKPPEGEEIIIIAFSSTYGVDVPETFLKGRVEIEEPSLIIRDVEKADAGSYTCSITTFPSGSFEGTTNLVVQEQMPVQMPMLPRMIAVGVFVLIVLTMFTTTYFIIARIRREASVKDSVYTDIVSPVMSD
ncbi:myelin protein P0-like isoform X2 [Sparus aurata]|uniref:myelin protein P0-like isoform X2 n=1 Tax=Sparus aurata TaxID=8175 RepID=UPI0011C11D29|nr:myelin protein P0-like isoform X2 [Sparus aurata]